MKTLQTIMGILLLSITVLAASTPQKCWPTIAQAAEHHHEVKELLDQYQEQGFVVVEDYDYAYCYTTLPNGQYHWGEYVYLLRQEPRDPTDVAAYVTIKVYIDFIPAEKGYRCSSMEVVEEFFY